MQAESPLCPDSLPHLVGRGGAAQASPAAYLEANLRLLRSAWSCTVLCQLQLSCFFVTLVPFPALLRMSLPGPIACLTLRANCLARVIRLLACIRALQFVEWGQVGVHLPSPLSCMLCPFLSRRTRKARALSELMLFHPVHFSACPQMDLRLMCGG